MATAALQEAAPGTQAEGPFKSWAGTGWGVPHKAGTRGGSASGGAGGGQAHSPGDPPARPLTCTTTGRCLPEPVGASRATSGLLDPSRVSARLSFQRQQMFFPKDILTNLTPRPSLKALSSTALPTAESKPLIPPPRPPSLTSACLLSMHSTTRDPCPHLPCIPPHLPVFLLLCPVSGYMEIYFIYRGSFQRPTDF